jgi:citrate synthase
MIEDTSTKIARPRQIYTGRPVRDYMDIEKRA